MACKQEVLKYMALRNAAGKRPKQTYPPRNCGLFGRL